MNRYLFPYHKSIHAKLVRTILIPLLVISAVVIVAVPLVITLAANTDNYRHNQQAVQSLERRLEYYTDGLDSLAQSRDTVRFVRSGEGRSRVFEELYRYRNGRLPAVSFQLSSLDGAHRAEESRQVSPYQSAEDVLLCWKLRDARGPVAHVVAETSVWSQGRGPILVLAAPVRSGGEQVGVLSFLFTRDNLEQYVPDVNHGTVITNQNGHVVYTGGISLTYPYNKFAPQQVAGSICRYGGQYLILHQSPLGDTGLWVHSVAPFDYLLPVVYTEIALTAAFITLIALMLHRVSFQATKVVMAPFDSVFSALQQYGEGGTLSRIPVDEQDELYPYLSQFNNILDEIDLLLEKNKELLVQTKSAEMRVLHSQFNPHFMFNMLDTIKYAIYDDPDQAYEMIISLSKMLRYTLDTSQEILVPLAQNLAYIEDYLRLRKARLGEQFEYKIEIPQEAMDCQVPKLIMQPIIENSISHGYTGESTLVLEVSAAVRKGVLTIVTKDNGRGIPPAQLRELRARLKGLVYDPEHIGMVNTQKRIQLHYGPEYGVKVTSQEGRGTTVRLTMRAQKAGEGYV